MVIIGFDKQFLNVWLWVFGPVYSFENILCISVCVLVLYAQSYAADTVRYTFN